MRHEIVHVRDPDGEECGHVSTGETEEHAEIAHLLHCLRDHDMDETVEAVVRDRLDRIDVEPPTA